MNRKVKALMILNGIKGVDIARELRVSPTTVYVVLSGKGKSARIQKAIAEALGMNVKDLWPNGNNKAA